MKAKTPSKEVLDHIRENYRYDPETGEFWRRAGHKTVQGYETIAGAIGAGDDRQRWAIKAHRLAYFLMIGVVLPDDMFMDHINRDRSDNRWENLRVSSSAENARNRASWGKVGSRGVHMVTRGKKSLFRATIGTWPDRVVLGDFHSEEEAANAYDSAAREKYGVFANTNR